MYCIVHTCTRMNVCIIHAGENYFLRSPVPRKWNYIVTYVFLEDFILFYFISSFVGFIIYMTHPADVS